MKNLNNIQYNNLNKKKPTINLMSKSNSLVKILNLIQSNHHYKKKIKLTSIYLKLVK